MCLRGKVYLLAAVTFGAAAAPLSAQRPLDVSLLDAPHVRLGSVHGAAGADFTEIAGAVRLSDGVIVVADRGARNVRYFDVDGGLIRTFGREGRGPEEFRDVTWLGLCPDGELLVVDPQASRGTRLAAASGRVLEHVTLPPRVLFNPYLSCSPGRSVIALVNRPQRQEQRGVATLQPAHVIRFHLGADRADTLLTMPGTYYYAARAAPGFSRIPLASATLAGSNGRFVYAAQNDGERVEVVDLVTGRRASFEHGLRARRMTAAAWDAAVDALVEQPADVEAGQLLRAVLSEVSPPAEHPRIMNLRVDRGGRVWLALPPDGGSRTWHVHSPDGTHVARVRMRSSLDPLDIFDTHIVAVERDELGVSTLVVYSLTESLLEAGG